MTIPYQLIKVSPSTQPQCLFEIFGLDDKFPKQILRKTHNFADDGGWSPLLTWRFSVAGHQFFEANICEEEKICRMIMNESLNLSYWYSHFRVSSEVLCFKNIFSSTVGWGPYEQNLPPTLTRSFPPHFRPSCCPSVVITPKASHGITRHFCYICNATKNHPWHLLPNELAETSPVDFRICQIGSCHQGQIHLYYIYIYII